jgi:DNA modification methylase
MEKDFQIIQGDALLELAKLPDASVDAVITDPPYCAGGISEASRVSAPGQGLRSENLARFGWFVGDNMTTAGLAWLLRSVAVESFRIVKPSGSLLVFCDWRMLHTLVPAIESAGLRYQGLVVWDKKHFGMGTGFRNQHEMIMHFTYGKPVYHSKSVGNVIQDGRIPSGEREHQTQKPVELLKSLISVVSPSQGIILDPFCGSGSSGVAALELDRRFIGVERSIEYVEIANARLSSCRRSPRLFRIDAQEQEALF